MKQNPILTIVVPVYNRASTIERCLDSIAMQTGIGLCRVVVVDNASDDDSRQVIENWKLHHPEAAVTLLSESRRGAAIARNTGLAEVDTPWTMFFDSDDIMLQGHLQRLLKAIDSCSGVDLFGWDISCQLPSQKIVKATFAAKNTLRNHLCKTTLSTQRMAVRTDLIREVGAWDERLSGWDDFELGVRLLLVKPVVAKLRDEDGKPLVRTFFSEESITGSDYSSNPGKWERALDAIDREIRSACPEMLRWVAFRRAQLAGWYAREGAYGEARRLLSDAHVPGFGRAKASIIYNVARRLPHGSCLLAKVLV